MKTARAFVASPRVFPLSVWATFKPEFQIITQNYTTLSISMSTCGIPKTVALSNCHIISFVILSDMHCTKIPSERNPLEGKWSDDGDVEM